MLDGACAAYAQRWWWPTLLHHKWTEEACDRVAAKRRSFLRLKYIGLVDEIATTELLCASVLCCVGGRRPGGDYERVCMSRRLTYVVEWTDDDSSRSLSVSLSLSLLSLCLGGDRKRGNGKRITISSMERQMHKNVMHAWPWNTITDDACDLHVPLCLAYKRLLQLKFIFQKL